MTAIATAAVMNDHDSEKESKIDHSPSRFTAVNGRDTVIAGAAAPIAPPSGTSSNGDHREPTEIWSRGSHDLSSRPEERMRENGNDQEDQSSQRSASLCPPSTSNRSKRKRSESHDQEENSHTSYRALRSPSHLEPEPGEHSVPPPSSNGIVGPQPDIESRNTSAHSRPDDADDSRTSSANPSWSEYDTQLINQSQRAPQIDASDAQLAEALQREAQGPEVTQKTWGTINRPVDAPVASEQPSPLSTFSQERSQATAQVAPKRKRVFSNRTKTGCMTCRRRKKKCDEQHPACNNCIRGGFLCEGYSSRSTWQKPSNAKTPVPLQSKEGYPDISSQYVHDINQHDRPQNIAEQLEPGKMRPIVVEEETRAAAQFNTSPTGVGPSRGSWPKRSWPSASHASYIADPLAKSDYREVPSIHELSREGHPKAEYQIVPPIRELPHGNHSKPNVPLFQGGIDQRPAHTSSIDTSTPQAQARMALSIEHQLSVRAVSGEETEKDKMIRGDLYRPFDIHLVEERDRCKAALWRFNNSCNPVSGLSTKEQNRLLKEILVPPPPAVNSPSAATSPRTAGSIGQGAVVEAPFQCHYGYNVHIGEDVMISESCLFVDDCSITIGAHTWIGPRVTILTSMAHSNMQERKGSQSRYQGRPVTIEEDCYVGAGCTIYPGVRLRRGAYVAPGEVVKSDIVAYGFQGLKPSYM
ncbi:hypothetical protein P175DRAFT_0507214 [Aspergillus ochraceoroseus IBT 24754]|uniref:Zn(2)-C6 fungal-type domain-containing protein n=3 Tax=Aspergillus subgen. Nidulantes TaxID=2720870 RepID=A0A2T5M1F3_9EURO|nr:uncharacterized protein P175DRAFT_0507214 [Aspergillus ochraceoroseus IBT 24754]KKK12728.1 putative acetyltransferase [Aspergillus rambellii]KKK23325.1 putative acetyltransferase [Aspergillus ochraceoroseus]PTU22365.1 hypothetical protein P175DRAFT_0507214 [Aspergillus ochraceoroseus IBT 24754]